MTQTLREKLLDVLADKPLFAVLDGAQFDHLPDTLRDGDFIAKTLYLDRGDNDPQRVITAPHLVWLDEESEDAQNEKELDDPRTRENVIDALLELIGDKPAAVFWTCPQGSDALYRHLRGINMVFIPKDEDEYQYEENDDQEAKNHDNGDETHQLVLFRHSDANVMAQVLPTLNPSQFARIMGPSDHILFAPEPEWQLGAPVLQAPRPDDLPPAPSGFLRLEQRNMEAITGERITASRKRIMAYLRDVAPEKTVDLNDTQLNELVDKAKNSGDKFGLRSEHAHFLWAYLFLATAGGIATTPAVISAFETTSDDPDDVVEQIMESTIQAFDQPDLLEA